MASESTSAFMKAIEKSANDPLQVLGTQKKVSFDETNLKEAASPTIRRDIIGHAELVQSSSRQNTINTTGTAPTTQGKSQTSVGGMVKPMNNDILSGRGAGVNLHPGNIFFRSLIQSGKDAYVAADPGEKKRIIRHIVDAAINRGRFLKQDPKTELWIPISLEEAKRKTGQALRENAPAIKKQQDEIKQKLQLVNELQSVRQNCLPSIRKEMETVSVPAPVPVVSPTLTQMASNYVPPPVMPPNPPQLSTTHLLWTRMNVLNEKQEQLKRKQRELEDEQSHIMQCFFQMSATMPTPMAPLDYLYSRTRNNSGSDSETDQIYTQTHKKRRIIDTRH